MSTEVPEQAPQESISLKDPVLSAFLAWFLPGLGHWHQGRRAKAVLYFICIVGLFVYGICLSSSNEKCLSGGGTIGYGRAVYFSWREGDLQFLKTLQIGVGLPVLPAVVQAYRMSNHRKVFWGGFMAPPRLSSASGGDREDPNFEQPTANDVHRQLHHYFELAGFFAMVAGLLNILAIYDAYAGPVIYQPAKKKEEEKEVATSH